MDAKKPRKTVVENRKARHEYHIKEVYAVGIVLAGTEVKSLRQGKGNLTDAYAQVKQGEVWLQHFHISPYEQGNRFNHDPLRPKKLLLHRREIAKLSGIQKTTGYTLIPLRVYLERGLIKLDLAVAVGKKLHDKREDMAAKDARRYMERARKEYAHSR
jgi:SsrA-binding protein